MQLVLLAQFLAKVGTHRVNGARKPPFVRSPAPTRLQQRLAAKITPGRRAVGDAMQVVPAQELSYRRQRSISRWLGESTMSPTLSTSLAR